MAEPRVFLAPVNEHTLIAQTEQLQQHDPKWLFVTKEGKLQGRIVELLQLDDLYDEKDELSDTVRKTQEKWIACLQGRNNTERTDVKDTKNQQRIQEKVQNIAREMGFFNERAPLLSHYDYGICLGDFIEGIRMRLSQLVEDWKKGVRFDSLIFLTGERYLRKEKEDSEKELCSSSRSPLPFKEGWKMPEDALYETEYDMVQLIWDQVQLPVDMAKALEGKVVFVNAPRKDEARPGTKDTYIQWLQEYNPKPGTILTVSYPLIWAYQHLVGVNALGKDYPLDSTAQALSAEKLARYKPALVSLVHDTVAKCLYEISLEISKRDSSHKKTEEKEQKS